MVIAHSIMPVIAAAAVEIVVMIIWYSDNAFGPMWKKAGGKSSSKDLYTNLAMHAAVALVAASALLIAINVFQKGQTSMYTEQGLGFLFRMFLQDKATNLTAMSAMKTAGFLWLGFLAPSKAISTIWSDGNWTKFMIEAAGQLVALTAMAAAIASVA